MRVRWGLRRSILTIVGVTLALLPPADPLPIAPFPAPRVAMAQGGTLAPMPTPRQDLSLVSGGDGKLYAVGGIGADAPPTASAAVEAYNPTTNTWTTRAGLPTPRFGLVAASGGDGKIYAIGGYQSGVNYVGTVDVYDVASNTWSTRASMPTARGNHGVTLGPDGKIYAVGGNEAPTLATVEAYDPVANTWTTRTSMPTPRRDLAVVTASNGKIYAIGGSFSQVLATVEEYDPATDSWRSRASLSTPRWGLAAVAATNGKIYAIGGMGKCGSSDCKLGSVEAYDPATNTWVTRASLPTARGGLGAAEAGSGRLYAVGGFTDTLFPDASLLAIVEEYDPVTDIWRPDRVSPIVQSVSVNFGAAVTASTAVVLTLTATDNLSGVAAMSFSNDGTTWGQWQTYSTSANWTLTSGDGPKTVHARVRDVDGNVSATRTAAIVLDTAATVNGLVIHGGAPATNVVNVTLTLAALDPASGVTEMSFSNDGSVWGAWQPFATSAGWTLAPGDGPKTVYARVRDGAGNVSPPSTDTIVLDTGPPTLTDLTVNGGAQATTATGVTVGLVASDTLSGVSEASFSNDGTTWGPWQAFAATATWSLAPGDGTRMVYARVRDAAGNTSVAATDTIALATSGGIEYGLSIDDGALYTNTLEVVLTISARPHTVEMQVSNDGGFAGAQWEPYAFRKSWEITRVGAYVIPRVVYVRFRDLSGNTSAASTDDIVLDETAPAGSMGISSAAPIRSPTRQLVLSATDDLSGVDTMRFSNRPDLAGAVWQTYSTSAIWDFTGGGTVYGQFRDRAGNVSTVYSQSLPGAPAPGTSPSPACSPRPPVQVQVSPSAGALVVSLTATGANNGLRAVRFDTFANAIVDVGDQRNQSAPFAVSVPPGLEPTSLQFTVRRQAPGQATTVRLVVIDGCGEWSTFVGGGPNAF